MLPPAPWDDRTKFVADTLRTIVLAVLGALAVLVAVKPWEASLSYKAEIDKTRLALSSKVVDDFLAVAYVYTNVAFDACGGDADAKKSYQGNSFDQYRSAENRLSIYFADDKQVQAKVKVAQETAGALFQLCKSGNPKEKWEAKRKELKAANNALAVQALAGLGFHGG